MPEGQDDKLGEAIAEAQRKAITDQQWQAHQAAHEAADEAWNRAVRLRWTGHLREHVLQEEADHIHHQAHAKEHELEAEAAAKAADALAVRIHDLNDSRGQLRDQAATFARADALQVLTDRVIAIEKLDIKGEGRQLGQGATVALIVSSVGFVATILGIIVVLSNLVTTQP